MNLNQILYQNILASPYFKSLYDKKTFHEVVDEIYNEVWNLAPFIKGTTPSTAFCCLFKFWTLRLTVKQMENLVDHPDSPYIRAIGFLYLRYALAPAQLWDWFQYYLEDDEEIELVGGAKPVKSTIGKLCRMLLTEQKFQGTMLPRIPVPIARDLEKKLQDYDREMKRGKGGSHGREEQDDRYNRRDRSRSPRRRSRDRGGYDEFDDYERRSRHRDDRSRQSRYGDDEDSYRDRSHGREHDRDERHRSYRSRSRDRGSRYSDREDRRRERSFGRPSRSDSRDRRR
ncbi:PRP38 family-domain-containing protein [Syncephalastrum racemosum]|uniref:Pre-mRNA-splicing factor 38 n=1 Tax=Syncephalastrum racemosum TaxID=13706 RepID=A0A1X2HNI7_SYNRA|nr:PRP38 family-domain-containing protein [Syncephalastrum racemosum]